MLCSFVCYIVDYLVTVVVDKEFNNIYLIFMSELIVILSY